MRTIHHYFWPTLFLLVITVAWGCSSSKQVSVPEDPSAVEDSAAVDELSSERQEVLNSTRSKLSDTHTTQTQDIPEVFLQKKSGNKTIKSNPYDGFRVQIISTRDMELADSLAVEFRMWADSTISGYTADSYVLFNQPYYKVHIGDFQQRNQANDFSQLVKEKYPDAWVVHDRIEPKKVPADTASFSFFKEEDEEDNDE